MSPYVSFHPGKIISQNSIVFDILPTEKRITAFETLYDTNRVINPACCRSVMNCHISAVLPHLSFQPKREMKKEAYKFRLMIYSQEICLIASVLLQIIAEICNYL